MVIIGKAIHIAEQFVISTNILYSYSYNVLISVSGRQFDSLQFNNTHNSMKSHSVFETPNENDSAISFQSSLR